MRRALIIFIVIIILAGIGVGTYFYFFAKTPSLSVIPTETSGLPVAGQETPSNSEESASTTIPSATTISARLVKISAGPVVSGEVVINIPETVVGSSTPTDAGGTVVKYIERGSGNVFSYRTQTGVTTRTSNQTVPGIESAAWAPDGTAALVRYLSGTDFSTINTYILPADSGPTSTGFFLPQNLSDISVSSTSTLLLTSGVNGSVVSVGNMHDARTAELFTTPLSALHISFAGPSNYLVNTKPSSTLSGFAFIVDSKGHFSLVAGPKNGLTSLASPSGKFVLISYSIKDSLQMKLVDVSTGNAMPLPVATITDKCVWAADDSAIYCGVPLDLPDGYAYPDDWYQGAVHFSDRIWKIDVSGRYAQLVLDFSKETDSPLDAEALALDAIETVLVFLNRNDGSLWSYKI